MTTRPDRGRIGPDDMEVLNTLFVPLKDPPTPVNIIGPPTNIPVVTARVSREPRVRSLILDAAAFARDGRNHIPR